MVNQTMTCTISCKNVTNVAVLLVGVVAYGAVTIAITNGLELKLKWIIGFAMFTRGCAKQPCTHLVCWQGVAVGHIHR